MEEKNPRSDKQLASDKKWSETLTRKNKERTNRPPTEKQLDQRRVWADKVRLARLQKPHTMRGALPKLEHHMIDSYIFDSMVWKLYFIHKICPDSIQWPCYKLITEQALRKANYSLAWHVAQDRLTNCGDTDSLREYRPEVYAHTLQVITKHQLLGGK